MTRLARVAVLALALIAGVVAAAYADDGGSGSDGGSSDSGSRTALTAPAGTSTSITKTTKTTPSNVTVTVPTVAVQPKTDDGGDDQGTDTTPTTTGEDRPADQPDPATAPQRGRKVGVTPADGTVSVRAPQREWHDLTAAANVPNGTVVDARKGTITLTTAVDDNGSEQAAKFSGAVFAVRQPTAANPVTELKLKGGDFSVCKRAAAHAHGAVAAAAARRKPVRRLFGSGHGRFRTEGRFAAATVHGTVWITEDYCDRTVVTVKRGVVGVTDLRTGHVVNVHAGSSRTVVRR
jgi:hypothetical protein